MPPEVAPEEGLTLEIVVLVEYVYVEAEDVPPTVVTFTSAAPVPLGVIAVICVDELTVKLVAFADPKVTAVAFANPVPVITTEVPPLFEPVEGEMLVIVGAATYVYLSADVIADVPPAVVTETSTIPAEPDGTFAVI